MTKFTRPCGYSTQADLTCETLGVGWVLSIQFVVGSGRVRVLCIPAWLDPYKLKLLKYPSIYIPLTISKTLITLTFTLSSAALPQALTLTLTYTDPPQSLTASPSPSPTNPQSLSTSLSLSQPVAPIKL